MSTFKNSNGYNPITCGCKSALSHWENNTNEKSKNCSIKYCTEKAVVGGHVINCHGSASKQIYIIPLCSAHNNSNFKECYEIQTIIKPVSVTKTKNCK